MLTREDLKRMDKVTRKLMSMHKVLHPRNDVDRLYVSRKEGRRVFFSIEDGVYIKKSAEEDWSQPPETIPHHHHHHVMPPARISLTLSRHFSLSFITSGRSSAQHHISSRSCCMYIRAGRPAFARSCEGVHMSISLMSSSLLLQQSPACLVCLTRIVFVMGGRWPYSWCFVGCCLQDLFNIACSILV